MFIYEPARCTYRQRRSCSVKSGSPYKEICQNLSSRPVRISPPYKQYIIHNLMHTGDHSTCERKCSDKSIDTKKHKVHYYFIVLSFLRWSLLQMSLSWLSSLRLSLLLLSSSTKSSSSSSDKKSPIRTVQNPWNGRNIGIFYVRPTNNYFVIV